MQASLSVRFVRFDFAFEELLTSWACDKAISPKMTSDPEACGAKLQSAMNSGMFTDRKTPSNIPPVSQTHV